MRRSTLYFLILCLVKGGSGRGLEVRFNSFRIRNISFDNFILIKIFFRDMKRMRILGGKFKTAILRNSVKAFKIEEVQSVQGMLDQIQQSLKLKGP